MPTILVLCASVLLVFAASLAVPAIAAAGEGDWRALEGCLLVATAWGFGATGLFLSMRPRARALNRAGVFAAAIALWVTFVAAAVPVFMLVEGRTLAEAVFEAASAATTLGITLQPLDGMSGAMAFYRGTTAWLGGLLTLLLAIYVMGPYGVGGTPNRDLRLVQHSAQAQGPRLWRTTRAVLLPYAAFTGLCALLLVVSQVSPPDALIVAMSMLATNGFVPYHEAGTVLANPVAEIVMMVFMVVGATSILWHRMALDRRWQLVAQDTESVRYLAAIVIMMAVVAVASVFMPNGAESAGQRAFTFAFDIVSVMTTTGVTHDPRVGLGLPIELVLLIALVGGCAYSTAGGIKVFRLTGMLHHLGNELRRLVHPHAALRASVEFDDEERQRAKAIWSAFFLAILTIAIAILTLSAQGLPLPEALAAATGAFSQIGNITAASIPGFAAGQADSGVLMTIAALALVSRIEILVVLAAVSFNRW